jgi:hypothetical protein
VTWRTQLTADLAALKQKYIAQGVTPEKYENEMYKRHLIIFGIIESAEQRLERLKKVHTAHFE